MVWSRLDLVFSLGFMKKKTNHRVLQAHGGGALFYFIFAVLETLSVIQEELYIYIYVPLPAFCPEGIFKGDGGRISNPYAAGILYPPPPSPKHL